MLAQFTPEEMPSGMQAQFTPSSEPRITRNDRVLALRCHKTAVFAMKKPIKRPRVRGFSKTKTLQQAPFMMFTGQFPG